MMHKLVALLVGSAVSFATASSLMSASRVRVRQDPVALHHFLQRVDEYVELKKQAAANIPPLVFTTEPWSRLERTERLARAIRTSRPNAKPGDVFILEARVPIRRLIENSICGQGQTAEEVVARLRSQVMPGAPPVEINKQFPWQLGAAMPPFISADLPPLPRGLQYRIVDWDLVLLDIDANLVVDFLADAVRPLR